MLKSSKLLFLRGFLLVVWVLVGAPAEAVSPSPEIVHLRVKSIIHPVAHEYIADGIADAEASGAALVLIELSTPGGLLTSTREIVTDILESEVPVVVYVSPAGSHAASAGFFILMAADIAVMSPNTNTGAAHPVSGQGGDIEGDLGQKAEEDAAAFIRTLAEKNGRNLDLAESAVVESRSFSAEEALESGLVDFLAEDVDELIEKIEGFELAKLARGDATEAPLEVAGAVIRSREMTLGQRILSVIATPNIAYALLPLGLLGIYVEISNPGAVLPGVLGAIFLVLAGFAFSVLPTNFAGVALVLLAILFFVAEVKVASFGLLTIAGVVCLTLGSSMLFKSFDPALQVSRDIVVGVVVSAIAVVGLLSYLVLQTRGSRVSTGLDGLITEVGVARSDLAPTGKVFVHGELWNARSSEEIRAGDSVRVVGANGMMLDVEREA